MIAGKKMEKPQKNNEEKKKEMETNKFKEIGMERKTGKIKTGKREADGTKRIRMAKKGSRSYWNRGGGGGGESEMKVS